MDWVVDSLELLENCEITGINWLDDINSRKKV